MAECRYSVLLFTQVKTSCASLFAVKEDSDLLHIVHVAKNWRAKFEIFSALTQRPMRAKFKKCIATYLLCATNLSRLLGKI